MQEAITLTPSQRHKKAQIFKKSLHKRLRTMEKNKNRLASKDVLEKRAERAARLAVIKKKKLLSPELLPLYPSQLTLPQKMALEKKLSKYSNLIAKLKPKMLKVVTAAAKKELADAQAAVVQENNKGEAL